MKIFVGNLPADTSDADLEDLFTPFGFVISATVAKSEFSGRSRGFGLVEMLPDEGHTITARLNGRQIDCTVLGAEDSKS